MNVYISTHVHMKINVPISLREQLKSINILWIYFVFILMYEKDMHINIHAYLNEEIDLYLYIYTYLHIYIYIHMFKKRYIQKQYIYRLNLSAAHI